MVLSNRFGMKMVRSGLKWSMWFEGGSKWFQVVRNGLKVVQSSLNWFEVVCSGSKWFEGSSKWFEVVWSGLKWLEGGSKWFEGDSK